MNMINEVPMPQITLELPEAVLETARGQARALKVSVEQYLAFQVTMWMSTGTTEFAGLDHTYFAALSDEQLLALIDGLARESLSQPLDLTLQHHSGGTTPDEEAQLRQLQTELKLSHVVRDCASNAWEERHGTLPPGRGRACCIG